VQPLAINDKRFHRTEIHHESWKVEAQFSWNWKPRGPNGKFLTGNPLEEYWNDSRKKDAELQSTGIVSDALLNTIQNPLDCIQSLSPQPTDQIAKAVLSQSLSQNGAEKNSGTHHPPDESLWWQSYAILRSQYKESYAILDGILTHEFGGIASQYNSDAHICSRVSSLTMRAHSKSLSHQPALANISTCRNSIISSIRAVDAKAHGLENAALGWSCISAFLAIFEPVCFVPDPTPLSIIAQHLIHSISPTP